MREHEIRCSSGIMFGRIQDGVLEVKCRSSFCGAGKGVIVLHEFDTQTGEFVNTRVYRDPSVHTRKGGR